MKKYQVILPVALPLALVLSAGYMVKGRLEKSRQYASYISAAQEYERNGVMADAVKSYQAAIALNPSIDAYLEMGQMFLDEGEGDEAADWYKEELLQNFPQDVRTYCYGIQAALLNDNQREAFQIYDTYNKRKLHSDDVESAMQSIWNSFDLVGSYADVGGFSNSAGVAAVMMGNAWGYIDTDGTKVLRDIYQSAGTFAELTPVVDANGEAYYIDQEGNKKLPASYFQEKDPTLKQVERFGDIQSNMAMAYDGTVWNYYDLSTYQKLFGGYKEATPITLGVGAVSEDGQNWALISQMGELLTGYDYQGVAVDGKGVLCRTNAVFVRQDGYYRLVDHTTGQPINESRYQAVDAFNENTYAAVQKDGYWLFVNEAGEEKDVGNFDELKSLANGMAAARSGDRWGYIDENGNWLIEPQFYDENPFNANGSAFVKNKSDEWSLLRLVRYHHG